MRLTQVLLASIPLLVGAPSPAVALTCWAPPVAAPVVEGFDAPDCPFCAGHRGIEYGPTLGVAVHAVDGGVVDFAGPVAGIRYVAVIHADGRRVTYGGLRTIVVDAGTTIGAGAVVGYGGAQLLFTVRVGGDYVDPTALLGRLVRRPWLVPSDARPGRPPPSAALRCPGGAAATS